MAMKTFAILSFSFILIFKDISCAPKNDIKKCVDQDCEPRSEPSAIDVPPKPQKNVHCPKGQVWIKNSCHIKAG